MNDILYCCKIIDCSENFNLVPEFLAAYDFDFSSWEDREGNVSYHTVFTDSADAAATVKKQLENELSFWKQCGISIGGLELFSIRREDWSEVWKKYFNTIEISDRLVIKPSWLNYEATEQQIIVEIDPGMSFGTGQHATTNFCLKMLDKLADSPDVSSFLDAGCGSGILSIAAAKLHYQPIDAFDIDPDATRIAKENFAKNHLPADAVNVQTCDLMLFDTGNQYDLVAANILGHILVANSELIVSLVKPQKYLILAGILTSDFDEFTKDFVALGMKELERFNEKEWTSGLFIKQ